MKTITIIPVLVFMLASSAWSQQAQAFDNRPKITVMGEAIVQVKPDKVVISLGIETWDKAIIAAKQKNNDILKKTIAAVKECGVANKDMQTDHLSIEPRWKTENERGDFIGYFVRNTLAITITDPNKVEDLITKALQAGVNYIHGIDFQTTEFKKYREQARELALLAAKEKAEKMAAVLGKSIGSPIQIDEDNNRSSLWYFSGWSGWGGRYQGSSYANIQVDRSGSGEITDTIALGKLTIKSSVSVTFELGK
jgi:uncharacterized protein